MKNSDFYRALHTTFKNEEITGRYITNRHLDSWLEFKHKNEIFSILGYSVLGKPIYQCQVGSGNIKLLIWSQMHGNESTTTKAVVDFITFVTSDNVIAKKFRGVFTFNIIPILNPDGAESYTRVNANGIDLNRDFVDLSQPESRLLMDLFASFSPDYCFNMHDQRTIFSVGDTGKPATISFLAPSFNDGCDINATRERAMQIIVDLNKVLQQYIPGQVGRFDDSYNRNCVGDTFQTLGKSTILFEAGHYQDDYEREVSREVVFISLLASCDSIINKTYLDNRIALYLNIPQNKTLFYDIVYKNVKINYDGNEICSIFAAQYKEVLQGDSIVLIPYISDVNVPENVRGHVEYDGEFALYRDNYGNYPVENRVANFRIGEKRYLNGVLIDGK